MAKNAQFLTTGEFAKKAGIPASSVTKLIRDGKIKAEKKSGKWAIAPDQLKAKAVTDSSKPRKKVAKPAPKKAAAKKPAAAKNDKLAKGKTATEKTYTVAEFAAMTYLTEWGVMEWLKRGRLTGQQGVGGEWKIDAANLETSDVKRLVRD
jgi:hypothetical protein